ncbi:hypothetical protein LguiB_027151 [Lonicera macranthoides]
MATLSRDKEPFTEMSRDNLPPSLDFLTFFHFISCRGTPEKQFSEKIAKKTARPG